MYQGKKVLVVGMGVSGKAAAYYLMQLGASVIGADRNAEALESNQEILALKDKGLLLISDKTHDMSQYDFIVVSPGFLPSHPLYRAAREAKKEIIGEIELGCRSVKNPILAITGTNGKTTVTMLVAHVLNQSGKKAKALGNVGIPFTKELLTLNPEEIIVLELSSYQLDTMTQKVLDAAVILNITPDHLDRYGTMEEYAKSKLQIKKFLKEGGKLYIEDKAFHEFGKETLSSNYRTYGYTSKCDVFTDLQDVYMEGNKRFSLPKQYLGSQSHDLENLMAAYAICQELKINPEQFVAAFSTFKKPAHRIEYVREKEGVIYIDDSKGTNVDAVIRAVQSLKGPIILIAGGKDKGSAYTPWIEVFTNRVKCICAIGQAAGKIKQQLSSSFPVIVFDQMDQAVKYAASIAVKGDQILLSPGCSSLDMYRDYAHRGEEFQRIVREL